MISWTTARAVAFEKVCSTSESNSGEDYYVDQVGKPYFFDFSSGSTTGHTQNATGYTSSSSISGVSFKEVGDVSSTYTSTTNFFPVGTITYSDVTLGYTVDQSDSGSFSTSVAYTVDIQTTTTETFEVYGSTTSSSTQESPQWTTRLNEQSTSKTEFVLTSAVGSMFFVGATTLTRTRTVVTESGTTFGNAQDTIYLAESNEVLWVINENPEWSKPLTDNAASTTQTTISDLRETTGLLAAIEGTSIESTASTFTSNFVSSSFAFITATVNNAPNRIGGMTTEQVIGATTSFDEPFWNSYVFLVSRQFGVFHYGNTETVPVTWETISVPTETDVLASESWQKIDTIRSTTENTASINNTVGTFTISGGETTSSCYGNTTKEVAFVGGFASIAGPPTMSVYSPHGVAVNGARGLYFDGGGIPSSFEDVDNEETFTTSYEFVYSANDGQLVKLTTASPIVPTWVTISEDSLTYLTTTESNGATVNTTVSASFGVVTYLTTTESNGATVNTTVSASFGVAGEPWTAVARNRGNLVGGNLADDETGLIRISRGLYKNQSGDTSFFEGNDTTYTGSMDTTYWYPISYLQPALGQSVLAVERNASTWPSFSNMP